MLSPKYGPSGNLVTCFASPSETSKLAAASSKVALQNLNENEQTGGFLMAPQELEQRWEEHLAGEFTTKDVEATLATMTDDASVDHIPVHSGGRGKQALRVFYRDIFIPSWPDDLEQIPTNRVVGEGQIVDEIRTRFTHDRPMEWFLPDVPPTHKAVDIDIIVVVQFRDGKIACERIYWDQATVLRQVGLLQR